MVKMVKAGPADARLLACTRKIVWDETYRGIYPDRMIDEYDLENYTNRDRAWMEEPGQRYFLFMDGARCVGYFSYGPSHYDTYKDFALYLNNLYIRKEYKGLGLGRRAFEEIRAYCKNNGFVKFCCGCNAHNSPAMAFYRHMGGIQTDEAVFHENKADDIIHFEFYTGETI